MEEPATTVPFVDGHNDVLLSLHLADASAETFLSRRDSGQLDLPRAREGGWAGGFFAIFVPAPEQETRLSAMPAPDPPYERPLAPAIDRAYARVEADKMIELLFDIESASGGAVEVVRTPDQLEGCIAGGRVGAILHFEGAEPVDPELILLERLYDRGLRSLGLVWSRPNAFAHGVPFAFPRSPDTGPGLTDPGRRLVRECNRLGILIDLSHLNERGFFDVAELSEAPLVASHSNAHALSPTTRNLTDEQLDEIARTGGIVGLTPHAGMLRDDGRLDTRTPLDRLLDHFDYVVERIGIDHVGLGTDFDGAVMIDALEDATRLPALAEALRARGYSDSDIAKLAHGNWLRVLRRTWR